MHKRQGRPETDVDSPVVVERVYDHPTDGDGLRLFVDRLWPRGLRKDAFHFDDWARDLAPSTELRHWYSHDVAAFGEFRERYVSELDSPPGRKAVARVRELAHGRPIVLLTATKDVTHSHAEVLADYLRGQL
ncbi:MULTISPECIES: DUF488 domain-containing protein [Rhodococcus]|jgi:uncharacterized protein YeaO (DUF488 family)|uniref:DUF488 family protein n=1 Tax=Rhodococcus oxybenzonivorans TaxID=1990687 RepID=A0AAE4UXG6_9NOCA|nr:MULTISPECIES: DUF488 family protein [Rhodococcus]MDV7245861.1 DUF488 family protein [Rhodococcus oxybenzonivorans]MDV7264823.1 DUF488 family protein [Rhodococcus oxybenzonivorans]MDV7277335.1 DUF488 family protein [Rhodococcus oxybenzonivorans]MDV7336905.1 DUF488 family protein [Rhodococcus oxybenzonivorans]MDV7347047.1 DUF488 family protein [Rhodococcus oxybenzonivorans]